MLYQSGISLGLELHLFASGDDEAAPKYFRETTRSSAEALTPSEIYHFAQKCDVVTFDHELVPPQIVRELEKRGCLMLPSSSSLELSANKANQRQKLSELGFTLPSYQICNTLSDVLACGEKFNWPIVVKPSTGGYDGRGVFIVDDQDQATSLFAKVTAQLPLVVEPLLTLEAEGSVLVVRSTVGECLAYPMVRTIQIDGMCREVMSPSGFGPEMDLQAQDLAIRIAAELEVVGILAVEFFIVDGVLLVNELAPRPHNTGHLTIEANVTSQFENHLRAILGLPLGDTSPRVEAAAMVNLIGNTNGQNLYRRLPDALGVRRASIHLYSKTAKQNRKIGHVTATGQNMEEARATAHKAVDLLNGFED